MKIGFVTGGTKGIGLAVVKSMLENGYGVAFSARNEAQIQEVEETLNENYPGKVLGFKADVSDAGSVEKGVQKIIEKFGRLDIVIANAGIGIFKNISDMTIEDWDQTIDINLSGVFYTVKATLPEVIKQKGYIITIASLAGANFFANGTAYNASKFGLVGFTQALMLDVRDQDVKVSTIMPGSVATHFSNRTPTEADSWKIQPEDIAQIVIDLLEMNPRALPSKVEVRPSKVSK